MAQQGLIYRVLVASPSDCIAERQLVRDVIYSWNAAHSLSLGIILDPVLWETHARPELGSRTQALINKQLVENCDILIGIFWTRLGSATGKAESGTAEEIEEFRRARKPVLLYFSLKPVAPGKLGEKQYLALRRYKNRLRATDLYFEYQSLDDLRELLHGHLGSLLAEVHERGSEASVVSDQSVAKELSAFKKRFASSTIETYDDILREGDDLLIHVIGDERVKGLWGIGAQILHSQAKAAVAEKQGNVDDAISDRELARRILEGMKVLIKGIKVRA